jgi:hypothetical protein
MLLLINCFFSSFVFMSPEDFAEVRETEDEIMLVRIPYQNFYINKCINKGFPLGELKIINGKYFVEDN